MDTGRRKLNAMLAINLLSDGKREESQSNPWGLKQETFFPHISLFKVHGPFLFTIALGPPSPLWVSYLFVQ
jgi:hypothetical protein